MEKRVFLIVLDSFGIGAEPDAAAFGDEGTNTLGALVAKSGGIRLGADAKAVEHDQKDTFFHLGFLRFFRVSPDK